MSSNFNKESTVEELVDRMHEIDVIYPDWEKLNDHIKRIVADDVSFEIKSCVIRYTYKLKLNLPDWEELVTTFKKELKDNNYPDIDSLFMGIND